MKTLNGGRFWMVHAIVLAAVLHRLASTESTSVLSRPISTIVNADPGTLPVPVHLYMPPNPPAPGEAMARSRHLACLLAERTTNYRHASVSQAKNIELVGRRLNGTIVAPGHVFSYYHTVGPYTQQNGYGWGRAFMGDRIMPSMAGGVCQGASTLYSALLRTGLPVVERHNHGLTVPYLPPGEDATVAASAHMDFQFKNDQSTPVMITAQTDPHQRYLTVAIWGAKPGPHIEVMHHFLAVYPYKTVHQRPESSTEGRVLAPGQPGAKVDTWLEIQGQNGVVSKREIGIDLYRPSPRILSTLP